MLNTLAYQKMGVFIQNTKVRVRPLFGPTVAVKQYRQAENGHKIHNSSSLYQRT